MFSIRTENGVFHPIGKGVFHLIGKHVFVQSAGIYNNLEINGFSIRVCQEIDVELNRHQVKSLKELENVSQLKNGKLFSTSKE